MNNLRIIGLSLLGLSLAGCSSNAIQPSVASSADKGAPVSLSMKAASYTVIDLGTLGGTFSYPEIINNRGAVTGRSTLPGDAVIRGFLWEKDGLIDVGALPAG